MERRKEWVTRRASSNIPAAVLESGERQEVEGPFKFYFRREDGWGHIIFVSLTGFNS